MSAAKEINLEATVGPVLSEVRWHFHLKKIMKNATEDFFWCFLLYSLWLSPEFGYTLLCITACHGAVTDS